MSTSLSKISTDYMTEDLLLDKCLKVEHISDAHPMEKKDFPSVDVAIKAKKRKLGILAY